MKLTDNPTNYTITVTMPEKDPPKFDLQMDGQTLTLSSGKTAQGVGYQQSFTLPLADRYKPVDTQNKGNQFIITVAKADAATLASQAQQSSAAASPSPLPPMQQQQVAQPQMPMVANWGANGNQNPAVANMARMQQQMNQMVQQMMQGFGDSDDDAFGNAINNIGNIGINALSASSGNSGKEKITVKENKDSYVVSMALSQEAADNVTLSVENNRFLKITTNTQASGQMQGVLSYQATSTKMMLLPGGVQGSKLTREYKDGELKITIPKI
ncbi:MAG: Hsp20/alpha crystallin family protein [Chthoniobacterales bacterium]